MADDGMDPCECLWNHELAMRRLLSLLRQGQSYCTDGECLEDYPALPPATSAGNNFMLMFLMVAMAVVLYVMRPRHERRADVTKPTNPPDSDDAPPNPPAIN